MKFLARFQRLERSRGKSTEAPPAESERFSALETVAPLPEVRSPPSGRFAPPELPLELDRDRGAVQPFVRCMACGRDAQRGTASCVCGARLDTQEVREFNAHLWAELQARQREEQAEQQQALQEDLVEAQRWNAQRRGLGEQLAREVAERERQADPPAVPRWAMLLWMALLGLFLIRVYRLAAIPLALLVLGALGWWWWRRREPPGH